jgi:hypothetical protein
MKGDSENFEPSAELAFGGKSDVWCEARRGQTLKQVEQRELRSPTAADVGNEQD